MATDRQTPCLYYVCAGLCTKGRKADHAHYCPHCSKYKPRTEEETLRICKKYNIDVVKKEGLPLYNGEDMDENFSFENLMSESIPLFGKVRYKNQKKEKLEKIRKNERY